MSLQTEYEFTLPRGYVDPGGTVHRSGIMRLATARDELEPLRNPTVSGPDDPRLTVLILARVVTKLGDLAMVTSNEIEGLFAADLAFLQDFYGVINFGSQEEYEALLAAQSAVTPVRGSGSPPAQPTASASADAAGDRPAGDSVAFASGFSRTRVEEIPRGTGGQG